MKNRVRKYINQTKGYIALGALLAVTGITGTFYGFKNPTQDIERKHGGCLIHISAPCEGTTMNYALGGACTAEQMGGDYIGLHCPNTFEDANLDYPVDGAKEEINSQRFECSNGGVLVCRAHDGVYKWEIDTTNKTRDPFQKCNSYYFGELSGECKITK